MNKQKKESWSRKAVVYQIYPRSFKDSNDDGVGDLQGIIEKLDYLNDGTDKSLGVGAIWLSPIYKSPMNDFGYDISDYYSIDSLFGNNVTFDKLIDAAHKRGMKVIMDFVPNHTSSFHPWFIESSSSRSNHKRGWYIWKDRKEDGSSPNNWLSVFGGSGWEYDKKTKQSYFHSFTREQPDLNWRNKEVQQEMINILRFWLKRGVDGFRTDAIYHLLKDHLFRDDPPNPNYIPGKDDPYNILLHIYSYGLPETINITNKLCEVLAEHEDAFMVSEAYLDIEGMMEFYKHCNSKLHAPFNFNLISLPWEAQAYKNFIDRFETSLSPDNQPNYVLGNHDRSRIASRLGEKRARLAAMLLFTLRGTPFIYYGDELGMEDGIVPPERIVDPWEKRVPGFKLGRDPARTPMHWDNTKNAGFSHVEPWLPVSLQHKTHNVERESADEKSMFSLYRELIRIRKNSSILLYGAYNPLDIHNPSIFGFIRQYQDQKLVILLNFSDQEQLKDKTLTEGELFFSSYLDHYKNKNKFQKNITLRPYEGIIIRLNNQN